MKEMSLFSMGIAKMSSWIIPGEKSGFFLIFRCFVILGLCSAFCARLWADEENPTLLPIPDSPVMTGVAYPVDAKNPLRSDGFGQFFPRRISSDKWGYIDTSGHIVIKPEWNDVTDFEKQHVIRIRKDLTLQRSGFRSGFGLLDYAGKLLAEPAWENIYDFQGDVAKIAITTGKLDRFSADILNYGLIDKTGKVLVEPVWDELQILEDGRIWVLKDDQAGIVGAGGSAALCKLPDHDLRGPFSEGIAWFRKNGKFGFFEADGHIVSPAIWDGAGDFHEGLAAVNKDGKGGYIDTHGAISILLNLFETGNFHHGVARIKDQENAPGFIDTSGKTIANQHWYFLTEFENGFARFRYNQKWGYIGKDISVAIQPQFDEAEAFHEGLARITLNDKRGFIDTTGKSVIPPEWDKATDFSNGLAWVEKGGKLGMIDKQGTLVSALQWDELKSESSDLYVVRKDSKLGVIDKNGKVVIDPAWEAATLYSEANGKTYILVGRKKDPDLKATDQKAAVCWYDSDGTIVWSINH